MKTPALRIVVGLFVACAAVQILSTLHLRAVSATIVISQVYGGGGNSGATYKNDFIELYNRGTTAVDVTGWTVQYASSSGSSWQQTALSGMIAPGTYYLVQEAQGAGGTVDLPTPNATGTIAMSSSTGKVALVSSSAALSGTCPTGVVDFVGFGAANCSETAPTPALSNTTAALRKSNGAQDTDNNSLDFLVGAPNPRNSPPLDAPPKVTSIAPANGTTDVVSDANIVVTFSEPVNVTGSWFSLTCTVSGSVAAAVSGGPTTFTIDPANVLAFGENCTFTVYAAQVSDQDSNDPPDTMTSNVTSGFSVGDPCSKPFTPIYEIQGSGATVAITGSVTTKGVVVGDFEGPSPALRGFFIQDPLGDGNPATSDGIFVFEGSNANSVSLGDVVVIKGTAGENQGQSQVSVGTITACGAGSVEPTDVTLPFATADYPERYEGMLVRLSQTLVVSDTYSLGRFGQVLLSSGARLRQPTDIADPGAAALAVQVVNDLNQIILDDASQAQNPDPVVFARGGQPLSASNTLRAGDTATGVVGVLNYTWGGNSSSPNAYRVRPVNALGGSFNFEPVNGRPAAPAPAGTLRVLSANLLNYFNSFNPSTTVPGCFGGVGGDQMDCRGADNQTEFDRQWPKTVAALLASNPDVLALTELENDGYGADSAIQHLVDQLDAATAPGTWAFIDIDAGTGEPNAAGTDAIKSAIFYKPAKLTPVGTTAALNSVEFVNGGNSTPGGRPSLAQAFEQVSNGARFVLVVNHFRSKADSCDIKDIGDGQGGCSLVRKNQATVLAQWLATNPTDGHTSNVLLVGDFNAYTKEDPMVVLGDAGYANLVDPNEYSYVFDGQWGSLDHALASAGFKGQVHLATSFHINADEPSVLDYNTNFKTAGQIAGFYAPDMYRAADHDQLIVDASLENGAPTVGIDGKPITMKQSETITLHATGVDPEGGPVSYAWDLDNNGTFETSGQEVPFSGAGKFGPVTVAVQATDAWGLTATDTATITVYFDWDGFFPPVENDPAWNVAKAGSAVPLKFTLGGDQGLAIFATGFPVSQLLDCTSGELGGTESATVNPGHSGLTYDAGQYTYAWKTEKSWAGTCRVVTVTLVDGSTRQVFFTFKK